MFHLGWFLVPGFGVYGWGGIWSGNVRREVAKPGLFIDMATSLERAGFDFMILEDHPELPDIYRSSLRYGLETHPHVRHDPMPLVPLLGAATSRLGIVATISTSFYAPFTAARLFNTLDHLTNGRVGMNIVTSSANAAAQNYGYNEQFEHDLRYEMADDWMSAVSALWNTWEPDALALDEGTGVFADHTKVHYANYIGKFHKTRGPLNTVQSPQQRPVICQAGGSPTGRDLAAKHADMVIASAKGLEAMKEYRDDMSIRMVALGRKPADVKVLFLVRPILGDTDEEAKAKRDRIRVAEVADVEAKLVQMSQSSEVDLSRFDLDAPFPDLGKSNSNQSVVASMQRAGVGKTLREVATTRPNLESIELVGTPDTVAALMGEAMEHVGGDGFLIANPVIRKDIAEVTDGLAPALRRQGLIRSAYPYELFRDNLLEF